MLVLVTGGCGFIGSNFIGHILRHKPDWNVVNVDKLTYAGNHENLGEASNSPRYFFIQGDIADDVFIDRLFTAHRFDIVLNFAAESHVDRSIADAKPFIETNIRGVQVLLETARSHQTPRVVQISTDEVYGSIESGKFDESSPLEPNNPYAASKAASDLMCRAYNSTYNMGVIITRSSNNYGPCQWPEKLIPLMISRALAGRPMPVYGEGQNVRDWIYVEDNCRAIAEIAERGRPGQIYNIAGGNECRNIDLVRCLCRQVALRLNKSCEDIERLVAFVADRPGHDWRYSIDDNKIRGELGWKPRTTLTEGLIKTVDWYIGHAGWVKSVVAKNEFAPNTLSMAN